MTFEEAQALQIAGRYSDLLRSSLAEQVKAVEEGRPADELRWTLFVVKACRFIGRTAEGLAHAQHAADRAGDPGDPLLRAQALHALAISFKCARRYEEALASLEEAERTLPAGAPAETRAMIALETAEIAIDAGLQPEARSALARGGALVQWLAEPRLLAWSLFLRSQLEELSPADLQLAAAYEIARTVECPELQWQILWRLAECAMNYGKEEVHRELTVRAIEILARLAAPLEASDATAFWRQGARRAFVEQTQRLFGPGFMRKVLMSGTTPVDAPTDWLREMGWDPSLIPDFIRKRLEAGKGGVTRKAPAP